MSEASDRGPLGPRSSYMSYRRLKQLPTALVLFTTPAITTRTARPAHFLSPLEPLSISHLNFYNGKVSYYFILRGCLEVVSFFLGSHPRRSRTVTVMRFSSSSRLMIAVRELLSLLIGLYCSIIYDINENLDGFFD